MKLNVSSIFLGLTVVSFAMLAGCAVDTAQEAGLGDEEALDESEDALKGAPSNFGYYMVTRRDVRKCAAPMCGGFFVKRVNDEKTRCADGTLAAECYVSGIQMNGIGLSDREEETFRRSLETGKALVKARQYKQASGGQVIGLLKANEAWQGATGSPADGMFYRAADNGMRCVKAPCPSVTAAGLNSSNDDHNVIAVHLETTANPADEQSLWLAQNALGTKEGILVAGGVATPKCMPDADNCGPWVTVSEFYLPVTRREGKGCGSWSGVVCNAGQYCKWKDSDICGAFDAAGVCSYRPDMCLEIYKPVCACDGKTYGNACEAAVAGYSVSSEGACEPPPSAN